MRLSVPSRSESLLFLEHLLYVARRKSVGLTRDCASPGSGHRSISIAKSLPGGRGACRGYHDVSNALDQREFRPKDPVGRGDVVAESVIEKSTVCRIPYTETNSGQFLRAAGEAAGR
jgi:hypothetical protein